MLCWVDRLLWALLFLVFATLTHPSSAKVIAVSNLQKCINTGTETELQCDKKIIVTLTIENNKLYQTEILDFEVSCINSPTGQCPCPCYYLDDPTCTCRDLVTPIRVGLTKTPVYAVYPLSQPRTVNGRPYEAYITTGPGGSVGSCNDDENDANPTCGWATVPNMNGGFNKISICLEHCRDSQGFCCKCPSAGGGYITRGQRNCNWSPTWLLGGAPGSAHCLRYDEYWWYRSYRVGTYQLDFDIQVNINKTTISGPPLSSGEEEETIESLTVNPSRMSAVSTDKAIAVTLLGDLGSYRQIQVLDGHYVMIPLQPGLDPNQVFTSNLDMWVVIPPELVTTTGECDKIGIDYTGFRYQTSRCGRPLGSCLSKQVYDIGLEDAARVSQGLEPLYNITRFGGGTQNQKQVAASSNGGGLSLRLPLKGIKTSLVHLEVKADNVTLVVNRAPAKIMSSEVCTYDGLICGGFQAIATRGFLYVAVSNIGAVPAEFRASVTNCTQGVLPIQEEIAAIPPGAMHNFTFDIFMENDQAGNRSCSIIVTDSEGGIADSTIVNFYTNATKYEKPPDQSDLGDKPTNPGQPPTYNSCAKKCPNIFNIKCSLMNGCFMRVVYGLFVMTLLVGLVGLLWVAIRKGWFCKLFKLCNGRRHRHHYDLPQRPLETYAPALTTISSGGANGLRHNAAADQMYKQKLADKEAQRDKAEEPAFIGIYPGGSIYSPDTTFYFQNPSIMPPSHKRTASGARFYNIDLDTEAADVSYIPSSQLQQPVPMQRSLREIYERKAASGPPILDDSGMKSKESPSNVVMFSNPVGQVEVRNLSSSTIENDSSEQELAIDVQPIRKNYKT